MLFSGRTQGFFVEINEYSALIARASAKEPPLEIEALKLVPSSKLALVAEALAELSGGANRGSYHRAACAIAPSRRFIRRASLEPKRIKEPDYLNEVLVGQFRAEPEKMMLTLLGAGDGQVQDPANPGKEVLFCGGYTEDFTQAQQGLLDAGIFPERLEIGSVAMLGGLVSYLSQQGAKTPTLLLELGMESTNCFIVNASGVDLARPIPQGVNAMVPLVQKELGLKDEESAAKLFFSNTFDFTGMGPALIKKLLKELQSSIGFYEVQTGQSIGQLLCPVLPANLGWLGSALASALGVGVMQPDYRPWLESLGIKLSSEAAASATGPGWFGLFSLVAHYAAPAVAHESK